MEFSIKFDKLIQDGLFYILRGQNVHFQKKYYISSSED